MNFLMMIEDARTHIASLPMMDSSVPPSKTLVNPSTYLSLSFFLMNLCNTVAKNCIQFLSISKFIIILLRSSLSNLRQYKSWP